MKIGMTLSAIKHIGPTIPGDLRAEPRISRSRFRVSELVGLRWRNVHADSITIDERFSRGDWGAPKSDASNATVAVNRSVIERIQRLKTLVVSVRAGRAIRHVRVVKSDGPEDVVFQSLFKGSPPPCQHS